MKKRIIGIVLVVAALVSALLGVKAAGKAPGNKKIIEGAVYVADGQVLAENEGKVVIVPGTLDADLPFVDKETGITLRSVVNYRRVEKLTISQEEEGDEEDSRTYEYWDWNPALAESDFGGSKKIFAPNASLGEFLVDEELLQALGANQHRDEYTDKKELNQVGWNVFTEKGKTYLYQGDKMPEDEEGAYLYYDRYDSYRDYLNTLRVSYDYLEGDMAYTIIGLQQNGRLVKAPELDMLAVHEGTVTADDLQTYNASSTKKAVTAAVVIAVALAGIGVVMIIKGDKKKK